MKKFYNKITIIIISYKSYPVLANFIKQIPNKFKVIIVENSKDQRLKKIKKKNYKIYNHKNNGFGDSLNFAVGKIKTEYFFQISPDLKFNFNELEKFYKYSIKLRNNYSALGPYFINADSKSHKQINYKFKIGKIDAIHGSAMFINKKNFYKIGKFDKNYFLYFEERDYCLRGKNIGLNSYQITSIKIKKLGQSVITKNEKEKQKHSNLTSWHFIWSKYYFFKKNYGVLVALIIFIPIILRTSFKFLLTLFFKRKNFYKYKYRLLGLINSLMGKNSFFRVNI